MFLFLDLLLFLLFKGGAWRVVKILSCCMTLRINCMLQVNLFSSFFFLTLFIIFEQIVLKTELILSLLFSCLYQIVKMLLM